MTDYMYSTLRNVALGAMLWAVCGLPFTALEAAEGDRATASVAPGWPQWRGPRRDGISDEQGLLREWPEEGPSLVWSSGGLGKGFGSPIVVGDTIYIAGDVGDDLVVFALDLDGNEKWRTTNGKSWTKSHPGGRSTCCYDGGRLYLMNAHGRLACIDASDGNQVWAVNALERFGSANITWGISESVLVDGKAVVVTPVGKKALMAGLDKETGDTLWATEPIPEEEVTYSSPILVDIGGKRQLISSGTRHVFGVNAETGALLWKQPHVIPKWVVGASPVFAGDSVYVSNATKDFGKVFRLTLSGAEPKVVWTCDIGNTYAGNVACVDGMVFGSRKRGPKGWLCVSAETGETQSSDLGMHSGSVAYADERFYCLTDHGAIALLRYAPGTMATVGRLQVVTGKSNVWAHPVIHGGRLYIRYHDTLYCYDIRRPPQP